MARARSSPRVEERKRRVNRRGANRHGVVNRSGGDATTGVAEGPETTGHRATETSKR